MSDDGPDVCQGCGYTRERHPMEFPEAPDCETFWTRDEPSDVAGGGDDGGS